MVFIALTVMTVVAGLMVAALTITAFVRAGRRPVSTSRVVTACGIWFAGALLLADAHRGVSPAVSALLTLAAAGCVAASALFAFSVTPAAPAAPDERDRGAVEEIHNREEVK